MKLLCSMILFFSFILPHSHANEIGVGIILGEPTGVSMSSALSGKTALDGALAYNTSSRGGFSLHMDHLWLNPTRFRSPFQDLKWYYGAGARTIFISKGKHDGKTSFGPRFPIGLMKSVSNPSIAMFAEIAVIMDLVPGTEADIDFGLGFRIRF